MHSIVVLIDHRPEASARVRAAVELALRRHCRLTLLGAVPGLPAYAWAPPLPPPESPRALQRACERECEQLLRLHAAAVPEAVPVTMSARRGQPHAALLDEVGDRGHDLVVLAPPRSGLLGALARARHRRFLRRCPAPQVVAVPSLGGHPTLPDRPARRTASARRRRVPGASARRRVRA